MEHVWAIAGRRLREHMMLIMIGMLDVEAKFESQRFPCIGSLYLKADVTEGLQAVSPLPGAIDTATRQLSEKYHVGPLISQQW